MRFGALEAVKGVSFAMGRERLGLVGASGAGKSLIGRALLRLLPAGAATSARRIVFDGIDIAKADPRQMRALRGRRIGLVLQDPAVLAQSSAFHRRADRGMLPHSPRRLAPCRARDDA